MSKTLLSVSLCGAAALLLVAPVPVAGQAGAPRLFQMSIESNLEMDIQGQKQTTVADTQMKYTWAQTGRERVLTFVWLRVKADVGGVTTMDATMSRDALVTVQQGQTEEVKFDAAPAELQLMLKDTFDVPMCTLEVDENGRELKRTITAPPGAQAMVDNGVLVNAILFHAPFMRDEQKWEADAEVSMGNGGFAKGPLTYEKIPGGEGGQKVKVTGVLTNDAFTAAGVTIKDAKYNVDGEQTYNPDVREYVAGTLNMDVSFTLELPGNIVSNAKGTMVVKLKEPREGEDEAKPAQ